MMECVLCMHRGLGSVPTVCMYMHMHISHACVMTRSSLCNCIGVLGSECSYLCRWINSRLYIIWVVF